MNSESGLRDSLVVTDDRCLSSVIYFLVIKFISLFFYGFINWDSWATECWKIDAF